MPTVRKPLEIAATAREAVEELGLDVEIEVNGETAGLVEADPDQIHQISSTFSSTPAGTAPRRFASRSRRTTAT